MKVDWFFSKRFYHLQKVKGRVYVYIAPLLGSGYKIQLYKRGETGICDIEHRSSDLKECMKIGDELLEKYHAGDKVEIHKDTYSPHNPDGFWAKR
ncbi:hypothetical protein [Bacillus toyonensis]|uniref:hypothetical protein n=1 Tax=Bacillus toyonensis TaxID=155322 RepID=UPI002E233A5D|nr:hypothetical protein [Bacillus toyonensis]